MLDFSLLQTAILTVLALLLDRLLGEPRHYHPLVGFGHWVNWVERCCYPSTSNPTRLFLSGLLAWVIAVGLPLLLILPVYYFSPSWLQAFIAAIIVYFCIAPRSLSEHARAVSIPLVNGDLNEARLKISYLVSRDTSNLNENDITKATVESVLENSHDGVIAPLFWFLLAGVPGVLLLRMVNTLDAMWGYRNERYNYFGRSAARIDDVLGYMSARITVLLFGLQHWSAFASAWRYGRRWYSPNAGPVMAAGAGALQISLGGAAVYHGELKQRPVLGEGREAKADDIERAIRLTTQAYYLFALLLLLTAVTTVAVSG